jgi:hypothetical protein
MRKRKAKSRFYRWSNVKERGNTDFRFHVIMNGVWTGNGSRDVVYYETLGWWHVYEPQIRKS